MTKQNREGFQTTNGRVHGAAEKTHLGHPVETFILSGTLGKMDSSITHYSCLSQDQHDLSAVTLLTAQLLQEELGNPQQVIITALLEIDEKHIHC